MVFKTDKNFVTKVALRGFAPQAMTNNLIVVTNNVGEFERVPWIKVEDWTKE